MKKDSSGSEGSDSPPTPDAVQAELSGETQYSEAKEEDSEDDKEKSSEEESEAPTGSNSKKKISKEDFFANLDAISNLLKGDEDTTEADNSK